VRFKYLEVLRDFSGVVLAVFGVLSAGQSGGASSGAVHFLGWRYRGLLERHVTSGDEGTERLLAGKWRSVGKCVIGR